MTMMEFINPAFNQASKPLTPRMTPTPMSPEAGASQQQAAFISSGAEPNNQPKQEQMSPVITDIKIPCNCGGGGWNTCAHHCAKLFQLNVHVSNLCSKPIVSIPKERNFSGDYKSKPGRLQCKMQFFTPSGAEKETLLNLGVATIMSNASEVMSPHALEKLRVGLQYCKVGADKQVQLEWIEDADGQTGTAVIKFKVRARRIRQHANGWELKDDAGSGIRGKPHESSAFRFWACLQHSDFSLDNSKPVDEIIQAAVQANSGTYKFEDVRVWSKGNCPAKQRKNSPRGGKKQQVQPSPMTTAPMPTAPQLAQHSLPFLPIAMSSIPMPLVQTDFQLTRGTKRPTLFTNLPIYDMPPSLTPTQEPHKRARLSQIDANDNHDESNLDLMADKLCAQLDDAGEDSSDDIDEIQAIINSLENDEDTTTCQGVSQSAWSPLGFDVDDLDQFSTSDLMLSVC